MNEVDDRLAGDAVWELFALPAAGPPDEAVRIRLFPGWTVVASLIGIGLLLYPPLYVVTLCLAGAAGDFRTGWRIGRSIPDRAGGRICARFNYAWGAMKVGMTAIGLMFLGIVIDFPRLGQPAVPSAILASVFLWFGGFLLSAALTFAGLVAAWRSGMRVWVGQGVNRARTLLLSMLIVAFTLGVIVPICLWLSQIVPRASAPPSGESALLVGLFGCIFAGPVVLLLILDAIGRRVIANQPGKFGPKVPSVGKWDS